MSDRYQQLVNTPIGKIVSKQIGLPNPVKLERYERGQPVIDGPVLLGAASGGRLAGATAKVLSAIDADVHTPMQDEVRTAAADAHLDAKVFNPDAAPEDQTFKALVFDASGIADSTQLHELWAFFHPTIRLVRRSGRVVVLGTPPEDCKRPHQATAQRALEGFVRSVGKEVRKGATAQLVYVGTKAEPQIESTLRFVLSPKSAYVSGQVIRVGATALTADEIDWELPLSGKFALVTGASRGIGKAIAKVLARDGAHVIGLDVPGLQRELEETIGELGGSTLVLDITDDDAPARIATHLLEDHGGVDVVVHNAGVTRDKTLGRMDEDRWDKVFQVNLSAQERINDELLAREAIRENGRIVCVSSMSGIAGNAGQTNYAASKAGVIGMVESMAAPVGKKRLTINAVAPGFIETQMTAAMPIATREAGRRMNSLAQGGLPVDVAETIAWFASPASGGVNGNVVRVCGQSLVGGVMATRELHSSPSMAALFARAGAAMLPGASQLPFVGGGGRKVPELTLRLTDVEVDGARVADYDQVCGFALRDVLPPTYPHMLAFPLQLSLMTDPSFPFRAIGLVHIANRITQHRPIRGSERLRIDVWATPVEDHPRGKQFSLRTEVRVGDELVWEEVSTNLKRGGGSEAANPPRSELPRAEDLPATATWTLPGDLGRRYASVSGDYNPIHVHPLSARLFGFPSAIAHGMWTKARCLAALEPRLPDAFTVDVAFKRPILLPGKVEFCEAGGPGPGFSVQFGVRDARKGRSHLDGLVFGD